jgi:hypothetical protein
MGVLIDQLDTVNQFSQVVSHSHSPQLILSFFR